MKIRFVGDIHGQYLRYLNTIKNCDYSIQVGDFGVGFTKYPHTLHPSGSHRFIRGNHDDPAGCKLEPNWIPDGTIENGMMFVGGADSIDKHYRIPGVTWWEDEQLSYAELNAMIEKFITEKPRIMVAHDIPQSVAMQLGMPIFGEPTRTRQAFDAMMQYHQPELYIAGHWHLQFDKVINGTRFVILDCHNYIDIDPTGDLMTPQQYTTGKSF